MRENRQVFLKLKNKNSKMVPNITETYMDRIP